METKRFGSGDADNARWDECERICFRAINTASAHYSDYSSLSFQERKERTNILANMLLKTYLHINYGVKDGISNSSNSKQGDKQDGNIQRVGE